MAKKAIQHGRKIELPKEYQSVAEMLLYTANKFPQKGITYIDGSGKEDFVSYPELIESARKYLKKLYQKGLKPGDKVILIIDNPKEFYKTFWACIFGGIIAAPVSQPSSWKPESSGLMKFMNIWEVLDKPSVIIEEQYKKRYQSLKESSVFHALHYISTDELKSDEMEAIYYTKPDELVFLQFSSGSTGIPKGVKLTNKNIIINNIGCAEKLEVEEDDVTFTWLPHTHDMGIFGQHLIPINKGTNIMVFSPFTFIRSPYLFLKKIAEHKGTWFCSTNFGYDWMTRKVSDNKLADLDLSSLRITLNGAEPISVPVIEKFIDKFSICGYKETMMFPAYGMAEATVGVCLPKVGKIPRVEKIDRNKLVNDNIAFPISRDNKYDTCQFVHEGNPVAGLSIRIASDTGETLNENMIGEIQIKGSSVTSGYFNREDITEEMVIDGWLRTGDLGFMVDNSLVVTGRLKDIIFVRGQNYFAHDLEELIFDLDSVEQGNAAIVGLFNSRTNQEELYVFVKYKGKLERFLEIRHAIVNRLQEIGIEITHVLPTKTIPKTTSGKIQRFILRKNYENAHFQQVQEEIEKMLKEEIQNKKLDTSIPRTELESHLLKSWSKVLNVPENKISLDDEFLALGGNSIKSFLLLDEIEKYLDREIGMEVLILCKTIREMIDYLEALPYPAKSESYANHLRHNSGIDKSVAITGIALRLPNAKTKEEFWNNLTSGKDNISKISMKRKEMSDNPEWNDWMGELEDIDLFDNEFFDIPEEEAIFMDPQQRIALETSYEALEDAGLRPGKEERRNIGVYSGVSSSTYQQLMINQLEKGSLQDIHPNAMIGNMQSIISSLISHYYNFTGPSITIDTACSSFLVALHHAVESIKEEKIKGAAVTGTNIVSTPIVHALSRKAGIVSSTNQTKTFDKEADGSVIGEGVITVYLEPAEKAVKENKNIYGVIRGTFVNNDGQSLAVMVPNPKGQYQVLEGAYKDANISPDEISYIETHGSGTTIGDPIEVNALARLFTGNNNKQEIGIGSVKSNIGHLFPAASGAGLVKVLLSLKNKQLVPSLNIDHINPALELDKTPFYIVQETKDWSVAENETRKAGISSFGFGGTNAHVVLEEWNPIEDEDIPNKSGMHLLTFSAKSEKALDKIIQQTETIIQSTPALNINNLSFTRNRYRNHYHYRAACLIASDKVKEGLPSIQKGEFLKKRMAKVSLIIDDPTVSKGIENVFSQEAASTLLNSDLSQTSELIAKNKLENQEEYDNSKLVYLYHCYSFIDKVIRLGKNKFDVIGIDLGKIIADFINRKTNLADIIKDFAKESEDKNREELNESCKNADIVLGLFISKDKLMNRLSTDIQKNANIVCFDFKEDNSLDTELLRIIKDLYVAGADFNWESLYPDGSGKLMSLPPYPFDHKSFWIK